MSRLQVWQPLRGASIDLTTASLFVTDHWVATPRLTLDLGLRFERGEQRSDRRHPVDDVQTLVPRLAGSFDLTGDGKTILQGTYGTTPASTTTCSSRATPASATPTATSMQYRDRPARAAVRAGFDPGELHRDRERHVPDGERVLRRRRALAADQGVHRGAGARDRPEGLGPRDLREPQGDGLRRGLHHRRRRPHHGHPQRPAGCVRQHRLRNTDLARRDYQALDFRARIASGPSLTVNGHWTVQLENDGNFEGGSGEQPRDPVAHRRLSGGLLRGPQLPDGPARRLPAAQGPGLGDLQLRPEPVRPARCGAALSLQLAEDVQPGRGLGGADGAAERDQPRLRRLPASQPVFFGARGSQEFEDYALFDLAVTYGVPVWQSLRPWVKLEVLNLFNNQQLISWDTTVTADLNGPKDANGLPLNYIAGPNFGKATSNANFARPRQGMDGGRTFILAAAAASVNVIGSFGVMPTSSVPMSRVSQTAAISPTAVPATPTVRPSRSTITSTEPPGGAERHSQADFMRALRDRIRDDAVDAERGEAECERGEGGDQQHARAGLGKRARHDVLSCVAGRRRSTGVGARHKAADRTGD